MALTALEPLRVPDRRVRQEVRCEGCGRRHVDLFLAPGQTVPARFSCHKCGKLQRQEVAITPR